MTATDLDLDDDGPCRWCGSNPATWERFRRFGFRLPSCSHCRHRLPEPDRQPTTDERTPT